MKPLPILTNEESEKLLTRLLDTNDDGFYKHRGLRNHTMALLMLDAGLRVGEVVRLLVTDLILADQPVTTLYLSPDIARKGADRHVPLRKRIQEALMQMKAQWWGTSEQPASCYAFCNRQALLPLSVRQVQRIITRAATQSIGRPVHPHVLRHTFATNLMRVTSIRIVQELLGHKSITSTQIYTHPNSQDLTEAIESLK